MVIRVHEYTGAGQQTIKSTAFPKVDAASDQQLLFYGVGSELTVQLFDLSNGGLVAEGLTTATLGLVNHRLIGFNRSVTSISGFLCA